jgi:hypothetical protein
MKTLINSAARRGMVAIDGGQVRLALALPPVEPASCPALETLVAHFELEHPHFPVPYGTADPTFTGGPGVDWKPVPRESASNVERLSAAALLSQALVAFAVEYEEERRSPIQWAANILRGMGDDVVDLPPIPKHGTHSVANLRRLGIVTVDGDDGARLTAKGRRMRDAHEPLCEQIESRWRDRLGSPFIDEVIEAVSGNGDGTTFPLIAWAGAEFAVLGMGLRGAGADQGLLPRGRTASLPQHGELRPRVPAVLDQPADR